MDFIGYFIITLSNGLVLTQKNEHNPNGNMTWPEVREFCLKYKVRIVKFSLFVDGKLLTFDDNADAYRTRMIAGMNMNGGKQILVRKVEVKKQNKLETFLIDETGYIVNRQITNI